jgi:hypothetical protein
MDITVPDTLNGAVLLSIIDFFLSFFVISFIGFVLAAFPLLNRAGPNLTAKIQQQPPPGDLREEVDMTANDHIAAISAATATIVGAHRIVRIDPARQGPAWLAEGRAAHHGSHSHPVPHAAPPLHRPPA